MYVHVVWKCGSYSMEKITFWIANSILSKQTVYLIVILFLLHIRWNTKKTTKRDNYFSSDQFEKTNV